MFLSSLCWLPLALWCSLPGAVCSCRIWSAHLSRPKLCLLFSFCTALSCSEIVLGFHLFSSPRSCLSFYMYFLHALPLSLGREAFPLSYLSWVSLLLLISVPLYHTGPVELWSWEPACRGGILFLLSTSVPSSQHVMYHTEDVQCMWRQWMGILYWEGLIIFLSWINWPTMSSIFIFKNYSSINEFFLVLIKSVHILRVLNLSSWWFQSFFSLFEF